MTSAYGSISSGTTSTGKEHSAKLPYIPLQRELSDGSELVIDFFRTQHDVDAARKLLNDVIEEGMSWPFENALSESEFRDYFFSHTALVARSGSAEVVGSFYCKPNFPGRCSHYCNGGFITDPEFRRRGIATCMGEVFIRIAKDLGFRAVLFNLVFTCNEPSIRLWRKLGFTQLARLPGAGDLRTGNFDALQFFFDLEKSKTNDISGAMKRPLRSLRVPFFVAFTFVGAFFLGWTLTNRSVVAAKGRILT